MFIAYFSLRLIWRLLPVSVRKTSYKNTYESLLKNENAFPGLAAVQTLLQFIDDDISSTLQEFIAEQRKVIEELKQVEPLIEVESYTAIFSQFTTLNLSEYKSIKEVKEEIKKRGNQYLSQLIVCKDKVAKLAHPFISDRSVILVNSKSSIVYKTLCEALASHKRFTVYVTQSSVDNSGEVMQQWLTEKGIECNLILDSAIGFYMEKVDLVLSGAEGVVENGGIINKIGTYPLALCAKAMNKPFYVLVESFKFARLYPLNQADIPERIKCKHFSSPVVDYTPPALITLLLTNLGTLTTAAVSDVLMQLYL